LLTKATGGWINEIPPANLSRRGGFGLPIGRLQGDENEHGCD
jgi:hypothetical protein